MKKTGTVFAFLLLFILWITSLPVSASESEFSYLESFVPTIIKEYPIQTGLNKSGKVKISWIVDVYMQPDESIQTSYEIELADNPDFDDATVYTSAKTSLTLNKKAFGKNGGKFYLRVRGNYTLPTGEVISSRWSTPEEYVFVKINKTNFPGLYLLLKNGGSRYNFEISDYEAVTYDLNGDGWLDPKEVNIIYNLQTTLHSTFVNGVYHSEPDYRVSSLKGIEFLTSLYSIHLSQYSGSVIDLTGSSVNTLQVSGLTAKEFTVIAPTTENIFVDADREANVTKMDFSQCPGVVELDAQAAYKHKMKTLILPTYKKNLKILSIGSYAPSKLSLNAYTNLHQVYLYFCDLETLSIDKCKQLRYLYFYISDNIKKINVTKNTKLIGVDAAYCAKLTKKGITAPKKTKVTEDAGKWWMNTEKYLEDLRSIYPDKSISFTQ